MMRTLRLSVAALFGAVASLPAAEPATFQELVRSTEPLAPEQERAAFHLPPGFEIQLVASEPGLRKPMNMQWDVLGRLWITESREYPFPVKDGSPGRDTVRIFSDFGPDGHARKVEIFADGLNIPTGLYPFRSPNAEGKLTWKCVVWSIPNMWLMEDTDGDGKADKREVLYGPLGWEKDTHGNISSFRRGLDGWMYGTHGFSNQTTMRGKDGSELQIQSGNTYRVRLDGSRVEGFTYGQVNPFGLCWDARGNLYSADCHSSPIYQLLRGAYYPSFGKPHDGLGFGPQTVLHSHGSTAICAPMYVSDPAWPAEYQDHMFVGNVQTSKLNQDLIEWHGSSSKGKELPDFLSTDDPWFRPVDLSWGPDGALYVADFYNRIIGHYEVPLSHPGRDRERGRLWRIVYRGTADKPASPLLATALPTNGLGLVAELGSGNLTRRTLALNELCDTIGTPAVDALAQAVAAPRNALQKVNALWALQRLGRLGEEVVASALQDGDPLIRTHALRLVRERVHRLALPEIIPADQPAQASASALVTLARVALQDPDALVKRCAVEVLAAAPASEQVLLLLEALRTAAPDDDHLIHVIRMALRDHLAVPAIAARLTLESYEAKDLKALLGVMNGLPGAALAEQRLAWLQKLQGPTDWLSPQMETLARNLPLERQDDLVALARQKLDSDPARQAQALQTLLTELDHRRAKATPAVRTWTQEVAMDLLQNPKARPSDQAVAAGLARSMYITEAVPLLSARLQSGEALDGDSKVAAARALLLLDPASVPAMARLFQDPALSMEQREKLILAYGEAKGRETEAVMLAALPTAPHRLQIALANALSTTHEGAAALVAACGQGKAAPTLLRGKTLAGRFEALHDAALTQQVEQLTAKLPAANVDLDRIIAERATGFVRAKSDATHGADVFTRNCAVCHTIEGKGGNIGPQLDGIGGRGAERLLEDILDPSRNVDRAFRLLAVTKKDGSLVSGLYRGEQGSELVLADLAAQEMRVPLAEIATRQETEASLMPPTFAEALKPEELNDLLAYLLSKGPQR